MIDNTLGNTSFRLIIDRTIGCQVIHKTLVMVVRNTK